MSGSYCSSCAPTYTACIFLLLATVVASCDFTKSLCGWTVTTLPVGWSPDEEYEPTMEDYEVEEEDTPIQILNEAGW